MPPLKQKIRSAAPFLKWAGGKRQLIPDLSTLFPIELKQGRLSTYCEPFLGGGAMFFHLASQNIGIQSAHLFDSNPELIVAWNSVQRDVENLIKALQKHAIRHLGKNIEDRREDYLRQRALFNKERTGFSYEKWNKDWIDRAARFIFLNRTGYNGLWRVNASGECNVPFGKYASPRIADVEGLRLSAAALNRIQVAISLGDFTSIAEYAGKKTFVYLDPPYRPLTRSAAFTSYTSFGFSDDEQGRLAEFFGKLNARGTKLMLSNSDPHNVDAHDDFFENLYTREGGIIHRVNARRNINSNGGSRGRIKEIVITNYRTSSSK